MTGEELKEFMDARGLNYRQMGELVGYSEAAVRKACTMEEISEPMAHAVKIACEIERLRKKAAFIDGLAETIARSLAEKMQEIKQFAK